MVSDEVGGYHGRAELGPLGEGGAVDVSVCMVCDWVSRAGRGGGSVGGGGGVVESVSPRPPL